MKRKIIGTLILVTLMFISGVTNAQVGQLKQQVNDLLNSLPSLPALPAMQSPSVLPALPDFSSRTVTRSGKVSGNSDWVRYRQDRQRRLGRDEISKKIDMEFEGSEGMRIDLDHSFGYIEVRQSAGNKVKITGEKRAASRDKELAKEYLDAMALEFNNQGKSRLSIEAYYPDDEFSRSERRAIKNKSIFYTIEIPKNSSLRIKNSFGDVDLKDLAGSFDITTGMGSLTAENLKGDTELNNKFGILTAYEIDGNADINNANNSVEVIGVTGDLVLENRFGEIEVEDVKGGANINGGNGNITVTKVVKDLTVKNSFGFVNCTSIGGRTTIKNGNGRIHASDITGNLRAETSFN